MRDFKDEEAFKRTIDFLRLVSLSIETPWGGHKPTNAIDSLVAKELGFKDLWEIKNAIIREDEPLIYDAFTSLLSNSKIKADKIEYLKTNIAQKLQASCDEYIFSKSKSVTMNPNVKGDWDFEINNDSIKNLQVDLKSTVPIRKRNVFNTAEQIAANPKGYCKMMFDYQSEGIRYHIGNRMFLVHSIDSSISDESERNKAMYDLLTSFSQKNDILPYIMDNLNMENVLNVDAVFDKRNLIQRDLKCIVVILELIDKGKNIKVYVCKN